MHEWLDRRPDPLPHRLRIAVACNLLLAMLVLAGPRDVGTEHLAGGGGRPAGEPASAADLREPASGSGGVEEGAAQASGPAEAAAAGGRTGAGGSSAATEGRTSSSGPGGAPGPGAPRPPKVPVASGTHGVTDTTIEIGIADADVGSSMTAVNGASGSNNTSGPTGGASIKSIVNAVVAHLNAEGGLAGRQIVPVYAYVDAAAYFTPAQRQQQQQRACAEWTEDHHVFAFAAMGMNEELVFDCAAESGTPMVAIGYQGYLDQARFEKMAPYWYAPHGLIAERRERAMAKELLAQGFFTPGAKVAVMTEDRPSIRRGVDLGLKPVLAAAGIEVTEIVYPDPTSSPWSNYALQLKTADVSHVVMSATSFSMFPTLFMMQAVDSQQHYPRWAIASDHEPASLAQFGAPRAQLANTQGMAWRPARDTGTTAALSSSDVACRGIMKKANLPETAGGPFCEFFFFLKAGFDRMGVISPAAFAQAVESVGTGYVGTTTIGGATAFGPARHDGTTVVSALAFDERCGQQGAPCFKYVGSPHPLPT